MTEIMKSQRTQTVLFNDIVETACDLIGLDETSVSCSANKALILHTAPICGRERTIQNSF